VTSILSFVPPACAGTAPRAVGSAIESDYETKEDRIMLRNVSRVQWVGAWVATVIVLMACSVFAGAAISANSLELWLVAGVVPPVVMLFLWHGAPATVAEMLRAVDAASTDVRR
jgi:hypothetical protein